jgi:hypothetical protein
VHNGTAFVNLSDIECNLEVRYYLEVAIKSIAILSLMIVASFGYTQIPDTLWTKTYGGEYRDWGNSVQQTTDSGFIIAGRYDWGFSRDVYLIKTNENGDTLWTKKYGTDNEEIGRSVQQTTDGGYVIVGSTGWGSQSEQAYLIKTDYNGDTLWTKTYGWNSSEGLSVQETSDGGYVIIGTLLAYPNDDVYLIKTDSFGDTLWTKTYGGPANDEGRCGQQTSDGGFIIVGSTHSSPVGICDIYLIKTDQNGDTLWTNTWGDYWTACYGYSVQQISDGGYIIAGKYYMNIDPYIDHADDVLIKTGQTGNDIWIRHYHGGYGYWGASAESVHETADSGYIVTGYVGNDQVTLFKVNTSGDMLWSMYLGGPEFDAGYSVKQVYDGGFIVTGQYGTSNWNADVYLIRVKSEVGIEENEYVSIKRRHWESRILGGPMQLPKGCRVYDITGRVVEPNKIQPGIYFIEIDDIVTQKVVKVR